MFGVTPFATVPFATLGAGSIVSAFVDEAVDVEDAYVGSLIAYEEVSEVLGVFDLLEPQVDFTVALSDTIDVEEAYNGQIDFIILVNEGIGLVDSNYGIKLWLPPSTVSNANWTNINDPQSSGWSNIETAQNNTWTDITSA